MLNFFVLCKKIIFGVFLYFRVCEIINKRVKSKGFDVCISFVYLRNNYSIYRTRYLYMCYENNFVIVIFL